MRERPPSASSFYYGTLAVDGDISVSSKRVLNLYRLGREETIDMFSVVIVVLSETYVYRVEQEAGKPGKWWISDQYCVETLYTPPSHHPAVLSDTCSRGLRQWNGPDCYTVQWSDLN
jgi:hypothetical protein